MTRKEIIRKGNTFVNRTCVKCDKSIWGEVDEDGDVVEIDEDDEYYCAQICEEVSICSKCKTEDKIKNLYPLSFRQVISGEEIIAQCLVCWGCLNSHKLPNDVADESLEIYTDDPVYGEIPDEVTFDQLWNNECFPLDPHPCSPDYEDYDD